MKKEARALLEKAIDSLVLSIECFNRPSDRGRPEAVLILLDHAFELLLKASLLQRGASIRARGAAKTDGFDECVGRSLSGPRKFLTDEEALLLRSINGLRDAAQHYLVYVSEQHLYIHCQAGITLFNSILDRVFATQLHAKLPARVLPLSTQPPTDLVALFRNEVAEVDLLLQPGKRRRLEAITRLRGLSIVDNAMRGVQQQPTDSELARLAEQVSAKIPWERIFPGVAAIDITANGYGPSIDLRITKDEGIPVHLVPEGTPGATTIANRRVDESGFYHLAHTDLARKLGISTSRLTALIRHTNLQRDVECFRYFQMGKTSYPRYSPKALAYLKEVLKTVDLEEVWRAHRPKPKNRVIAHA